ncbi:acetyl/propionyl/methylcrotonyl-CoA carboxylase subunit alpha, partial [Leucobacter soli]
MRKVLIANRGEIAARIARACDDQGLESVAVYAGVDADAPHVSIATEAYALRGATPSETYLDGAQLLEIAERSGCDAVHPGYGFLSENGDFAEAVVEAGLTWIGPSAKAIRLLGDKVSARAVAMAAGAPLAPGSDGPVSTADEIREFAILHGLPVVVKAAFGGGGRGMKVVDDLDEIDEAFASAVREARLAFGRPECFVEKFLERPRHIEAQVLADAAGNVRVIGTRDCTLQRRNQKLVEEAPAPFLSDEQRAEIVDSAAEILRNVGYVGAGTVEYLLDRNGMLSFLEVNTRLQVEHPITEETSGIDLVAAQLRIASGEALDLTEPVEPRCHAFEFRINAEDPGRGFLPSPGRVKRVQWPTGPGVRIDAGVRDGSIVPDQFDSLVAKIIVTGRTREEAIRRARRALDECAIDGIPTVLPFHRLVLNRPEFTDAGSFSVHTTWIESELAERIEANPDFGVAPASGDRTTFTIEVDGRRVELGVPAALAAALTGGGAHHGAHHGTRAE